MAWYPGDGFKHGGRRPNGWPDDGRAPDGYLVDGFRKVRKDGKLLVSGQLWQHDELLPHVGKWVRFQIEDPYSSSISVFIGDAGVTPHNYVEHHSSFYTTPVVRIGESLGDR